MGRFAHLLQRDVVGGRKVPAAPPPSNTDAVFVPPGELGPASRNQAAVLGPPDELLQPGLATQLLFQQLEPVAEPLVDLQVVTDESLDDGKRSQPVEGDQDFFHSTSLAAPPVGGGDVEANWNCPLPSRQGGLPFDIGIGQMQSMFPRAIDFAHEALNDTEDEDDAATDSSSSTDSASVSSGMGDELETYSQPASSSTMGLPTVLHTSPWVKPRKVQASRTAVPKLNVSAVKQSTPQLDTPGSNVDKELDQELAYIKLAMESSEKLLLKSDAIRSNSEIVKSKAPEPQVGSQPPANAGTVGLMIWMTKNQELVITGFEKGGEAGSCGLILGDAIVAVDGENVEGWAAERVAAKLAGQLHTTVSLCVSRIYAHYKTYHNVVLVRDIAKGPTDAEKLQPASPVLAKAQKSPSQRTELLSPFDPIIMALQQTHSLRSAAPAVSTCEHSGSAVCDDGQIRKSPAFEAIKLQFDSANKGAHGLLPPWNTGSGRAVAAFLPSPRLGSRAVNTETASDNNSDVPLHVRVSPQHAKLRTPLGQIQNQDSR
jgi:hypothetical protein